MSNTKIIMKHTTNIMVSTGWTVQHSWICWDGSTTAGLRYHIYHSTIQCLFCWLWVLKLSYVTSTSDIVEVKSNQVRHWEYLSWFVKRWPDGSWMVLLWCILPICLSVGWLVTWYPELLLLGYLRNLTILIVREEHQRTQSSNCANWMLLSNVLYC